MTRVASLPSYSERLVYLSLRSSEPLPAIKLMLLQELTVAAFGSALVPLYCNPAHPLPDATTLRYARHNGLRYVASIQPIRPRMQFLPEAAQKRADQIGGKTAPQQIAT